MRNYEYDDALDEEKGTESSDESINSIENVGKGAPAEPIIDDMVAGADEDLVRRFLLEALKHDEKLALRFRSLCSPVISAADMGKYKKRVNQLIRSYRELADILIEMQQFPGGQQKSAEIERHWREAYGNRRAMMDELNQIHGRTQ